MPASLQSAKSIFCEAIELSSIAQRKAYVDEACATDPELRQEVGSLLAAHDAGRTFLEPPAFKDSSKTGGSAAEAVGSRIGPYKLLDQLGEGGMGVVYAAEQSEPIRRRVALKIIKPGMDSRRVIARFEAERQALALMDHPNIARVLDASTTEAGRPYFVMELVDGVPITDFCEREQLSIPERLRLMISVCRAVQHAHQKGILHRDLKPSNVLVTLQDGAPVPKVIDFGIAKALHRPLTEKTAYTGQGLIIGTPMYMSPEQADLSGLDVDTRSDVYSLGVLLYEVLAGVPPFDPESLRRIGPAGLQQFLRDTDPPRPSTRVTTLATAAGATHSDQRQLDRRRLQQALRGDLDWVVMKALEKDRNRRYGSAAELADDIERYLQQLPVLAGPPTWWYRFRKLARRNRSVLASAVLVFVALATGLALAVVQRNDAIQARRLVEETLGDVRQEKQRAETLLYAADVRLAARALAEGDAHQAIELLNRHFPAADGPDLRGVEWHYLLRQARGSLESQAVSDQSLYTVILSPDRQSVLAAGGDGQIAILDAETLQVRRRIDSGQREVNGLSFSPDGRTLYSSGDDGTVRGWAYPEGILTRTIPFSTEVAFLALPSPDGRFLIVCGSTPEVAIFDLETGDKVGQLKQHERPVEAIALSPDGRWLACASSDRRLSIWDWQQRKLVHLTGKHKSRLIAVAFTPDGTSLVHGSAAGELQWMETGTWKTRGQLHLADPIQALAVSPDGAEIALTLRTGTVSHLRWKDFEQAANPTPGTSNMVHEGRAYGVAWQDANRLLSVGADGRLYRTPLSQEIPEGELLPGVTALHVAVSPNARWIAWVERDQIGVFDRTTDQSVTLPNHPEVPFWSAITFSPDGRFLLAGTEDGRIAVSPVTALNDVTVHRLPEPVNISSLRFARSGERLVLTSRKQDLVMPLTFPDLRELPRISIENNQNSCLSSEGQYVAFNDGRDVRIVDGETGEVVAESPRHHSETITDLQFVGPNDVLVTIGEDRAVRTWDWRRGAQPELVGVHSRGAPIALAATTDGNTLFSASRGGEVLVWNRPARQRLFPLATAKTAFLDLALASDVPLLLTVDGDQQVRGIVLADGPSSAAQVGSP